MPKTEMCQEVRLRLEVALTVRASHSTEHLAEMLKRGIRCAFPNNHKEMVSAQFKEEHAIYHDGKWQNLY